MGKVRVLGMIGVGVLGSTLAARAGDTAGVGAVTYSKDVASIIQNKCQGCHRPGQVGPFALMDYADAKRWRLGMAEVVEEGRMPPWHADPAHGTFSNDRSLSATEKATLLAWVEQDCPEGDPADLPPARTYSTEWALGTPDAIFEIPRAFDIPADGLLPYQWFTVQTDYPEDRWLQGMEVRPGTPEAVHHILIFVSDPKDPTNQVDNEAAGGQLTGYAPGSTAIMYPPGTAKRLPAGAKLLFQIHYTPIGRPLTDRSRIAVKFATEPVTREVQTVGIFQPRLEIPAGDDNYEATRELEIPTDVTILSLWPHMHLRGKDFLFRAAFPDGREEILLNVPGYDFNWQTTYEPAEPLKLPQGTKITCVAHFNNSKSNPFNPDPDRTVNWGPQTYDEMMIGYMDYIVDASDKAGEGNPLQQVLMRPRRTGNALARAFQNLPPEQKAAMAFKRIDKNGDGVIGHDELDDPRWFTRFDLDENGEITLTETEESFRRMEAARKPSP